MEINTDHWDKRDYLAFVLYYLASADGLLEDREVQYMAHRLGKEHLDHIRELCESCSDADCLDVIREMRPRFYPGETGLDSLKLEMEEMCSADGHFSRIESAMIHLLVQQLH